MGKIRSDKNIEALMALLKKANVKTDDPMKPQMKVWMDKPCNLNDDELRNAANYLRDERNLLANKLVEAGTLEPDWISTRKS